jgi:hypothetical protein
MPDIDPETPSRFLLLHATADWKLPNVASKSPFISDGF